MDTKLIKQKILDLAIRGKLVPQNPADEPASVLLERIKAEKAQLIKEGKIKKEKPLAPIEEVPFEIPESWEWCRLGSICSKFSTGPFGSMVHKTDYVLENGIPMINPANIINGSISKNKLMLVSIERSKELLNYRLNIDDVILARRGDLSKCAIISSQQEGWLCGTGSFFMHLLELEPRFFQVIYATSDIQSYLSSESVGATMDNLNQGLLSNMVIPIPPLEEQKRIVAEIDRWFKWIDELEQNQQDLHTAIKQAKSKILDLAIHGKLVPQDANDEPASVLLDRIKAEKAQLIKERNIKKEKPMGSIEEFPFIIPRNWIWTYIDTLAIDMADGPFGSNLKAEHYTDKKEVRIIQLSNIGEEGWKETNTKYTTFDHLKTIQRSEVYPGNLVIAKMMPAGRAIICPDHEKGYVLSSDAVKLCPSNCIYNRWLLYTINSPEFKKQVYENVQGVTRARTSIVKLKQCIVPLPPETEQKRIVTKIEELFVQLDKIEESLN